MGYTNEVTIKCEKKAYEMLKRTCHDASIIPDKIFKDGDEYILYWEWINWYEYYENVSAIIKTLDKLDELQDPNNYEDTGYGYRFVRIGKDNDDIETRENDWDIELHIIRKIAIPDGLEEETLFNAEEKFIEAFKKRYNYDDIDEKYFNNKKMIDAINECIEDYEGVECTEDEMAKIVYEKLYVLEYGDTSDVDDLSEIRKDIDNRFPDGRAKM